LTLKVLSAFIFLYPLGPLLGPVKKLLKLKANLYLTGIKGITADNGNNKKIFWLNS